MPAGQLLEGRVTVITGAGSGIGEAVAGTMAAEGAAVVMGDVDPRAGAVAQRINDGGGRALYLRTDVTDETSVEALMRTAVERFGSLDILVANAGIPEVKAPVHELDLARWQRVLDINLTGVALCNKFAAAYMVRAGSGSVINMASILAHVGQANSTAYSAAKAGVVNFTRSAALTYARQGIRFNAVSPGYVDTPLLAELPAETRAQMLARQPIGRLARAQEIADVVVFLASDKASIITGACINADGGYTAI
ncbi:SDR family oxidoreductase [Arthrobacter sp. I2-34]|uniref:SDR family oxidoreductase n=1 Tax=Arthrobacter hankyongi TaxID=2904801 RepID=A0ABS9L257_9MICC|nr:SDR family NAD(P)-dependent oxidoreductase [Arthrobacter hankyongi]MCG2620732.1 SDR family oxidoreductase [Arthrobacter hankyongi]